MNEEFFGFFWENDFHTGTSLDGPEEINDLTRVYPNGRGAFKDIWRGMQLVKERSRKKRKNNDKEKKIPICLINYDVFVGSENKFNGHYIIITGFSNNRIFYHNNGPKNAGANKKISKQRFSEAWNLCFFDHDLIVV